MKVLRTQPAICLAFFTVAEMWLLKVDTQTFDCVARGYNLITPGAQRYGVPQSLFWAAPQQFKLFFIKFHIVFFGPCRDVLDAGLKNLDICLTFYSMAECGVVCEWWCVGCVIAWSMSPINIRKSRGPNTEPWGTPLMTSVGYDLYPLTAISWVLDVRKLWIHTPSLPVTPIAFSLCSRIPWSTRSKALEKSRYTISTFWPPASPWSSHS